MPSGKLYTLLTLLLCLVCIGVRGAVDLSQLVQTPEKLWQTNAGELLKQNKNALHWMDAEKSTIYCPAKSLKTFTWQNSPVYDLHFMLRKQKVAAMSVVIYAKGDVGKEKLEKEDFLKLLKRLSGEIAGKFNKVLCEKRQVKIGGTKAWVWSWKNKKMTARIKYAINDKGVPEFLTLEFLAPGYELGGASRSSMRSSGSSGDVRRRIRRDKNGDCYLIVPMVDQGSKGYCVPATLERVLTYYGIRIEQSTLAQMIGADAAKGTSLAKTIIKLRDIDGRLGLTYAPRGTFEDLGDPRRVNRMLNRYNRLARRQKKQTVKPGKDWLKHIDYQVFKELRGDRGADAFFDRIKADIDRGIPIFWAVIMFPADKTAGKQKEPGYHLRLITGYNAESRKVIFSDSWGQGNEKKVLPLADAWTITRGTFVMTMRNR